MPPIKPFFRGEYDKAIALYETIVQVDQTPRIYRDLAWCYQQLGNSPKALEYLGLAVRGISGSTDRRSE